MSNAIRRHLEAILDEGNPPARRNHNPQGRVLVLEVPIPGDGHEDVGYGEQQDCVHELPFGIEPMLIALNRKILASYPLLFHRDG